MQNQPFYLFLRYYMLQMDPLTRHTGDASTEADPIAGAMRILNIEQRLEIARFIDTKLAMDSNPNQLRKLFDDGNTFHVWKSDDSPRQLLNAIRDAALSSG